MNDYGIPHNADRFQDILNQSWPPAEIARELKNRDDAIDVRVRVVFDPDGEQWLEGIARRWWQQHVCVECDDPRLRIRYLRVDAADVKRRSG